METLFLSYNRDLNEWVSLNITDMWGEAQNKLIIHEKMPLKIRRKFGTNMSQMPPECTYSLHFSKILRRVCPRTTLKSNDGVDLRMMEC